MFEFYFVFYCIESVLGLQSTPVCLWRNKQWHFLTIVATETSVSDIIILFSWRLGVDATEVHVHTYRDTMAQCLLFSVLWEKVSPLRLEKEIWSPSWIQMLKASILLCSESGFVFLIWHICTSLCEMNWGFKRRAFAVCWVGHLTLWVIFWSIQKSKYIQYFLSQMDRGLKQQSRAAKMEA